MVDAILGVIGTLLYPLFSIIFLLIDLVQNIFRSFAGVGTVYYAENGGIFNAGLKPVTSGAKDKDILADDNGGIVYYLLRSDLIMDMVWAIATLALILLIVFTVIAFIRNIYAPKSKSWQEIIGLAVKGLFNFIFIPVLCLLGVILGNILLNAIDGATSRGGATIMSRKLFLCAAYDANIVRANDDWASKKTEIETLYKNATGREAKSYTSSDGQSEREYYANLIDEAFASGNKSIYEWFSVGPWYNMWGINYLTLLVGGIFMMYALGAISFGMIKRMFILVMLFIISPAACAMYPLDEGNATKQVTGDFKKNTISAYGAVAGMNLFLSIAPMVQNINLMDATIFQSLIHLILLVCGLFVVKDFISMISNYFGAGNAYSDGAGLMTAVKSKAGGTVMKGAKAIGTFKKAVTASRATGSAGTFFKSLGGDTLSNVTKMMTGLDLKDMKKSWKESGEEGYKYADERFKGIKARNAEKDEKIEWKKDRENFEAEVNKKTNDNAWMDATIHKLKEEDSMYGEIKTDRAYRRMAKEVAEGEVRKDWVGRYDLRDFTKEDQEAAVIHLAGLKGERQKRAMYQYQEISNGEISVEDWKKKVDAYKDRTKNITGDEVGGVVNTVQALGGQIDLTRETIDNIINAFTASKYKAGSFNEDAVQSMFNSRQLFSPEQIEKAFKRKDGAKEAETMLEYNKVVDKLIEAESRRNSLMNEQEAAVKSYIKELTATSNAYKSLKTGLDPVIKELSELAKGLADGTKDVATFSDEMSKIKDKVKGIVKNNK